MIEGGVYSTDAGDGKFGVVKILKVESGIVHVRVYKNKFATRPESVKVDELSLGTINDKDGFGMGHLPISGPGGSLAHIARRFIGKWTHQLTPPFTFGAAILIASTMFG